MLTKQLRRDDYVGIAVYGSNGRRLLNHTNDTEEILSAIDKLTPDGSTNAEEGLRIGYDMAEEAFREGCINRVILCSDGVANTGEVAVKNLLAIIERQRRKGIQLSAIGFGMNNYNDTLMEQLGDKGDGHYAYVDTLDEAKRVFVDNLTGTLQVVARDTKVQVEFNPKVVKSWRLLGYENRDVADKDFRNDAVDGGEVGSGHSVTALYELKLFENAQGAIGTATIRYKHDERDEFIEVNREITTSQVAQTWEAAPTNLRLAANVAEFGELLRKSYWAKGGSFELVLEDVKKLIAETDDSKVLDLATLITKARDLDNAATTTAGGE
jgi:Ca-activated chloride channel family protein